MKKNIGIFIICLGVISSIIFFISGVQFNNTASEMKGLKSQSGNTVAEFYYQDVGKMNAAFGTLANAFAIGIIAISLAIGTYLILDDVKDKNLINNDKIDETLPPL